MIFSTGISHEGRHLPSWLFPVHVLDVLWDENQVPSLYGQEPTIAPGLRHIPRVAGHEARRARVEASAAGAGTAAAPTEALREPERCGSPGSRGFPGTNGAAAGAPGSGGASPAPRHRLWHPRGCGTARLLPTGLRAGHRDAAPRLKIGKALPQRGCPNPAAVMEQGRPRARPSPGGSAGGWGSPSWERGAESRRQPGVCACSRDGNEPCSAQPLPGPISCSAGRTVRAPGMGGRGPPYLELGTEEGKLPSSALAGAGGSRCRAAAERAGAHARGHRAAAFCAKGRK